MICQLLEGDFPAVKRIYGEAFDMTVNNLDDLQVSWDTRSRENSYGIFTQDTLSGFVLGSFHKKSGANLYIDYIAVDVESRGQGLGTQLIHHLIDKCSREHRGMHLFPDSFELAAWYKTFGFYETPDTKPIAGKPAYYLNWSPYSRRS